MISRHGATTATIKSFLKISLDKHTAMPYIKAMIFIETTLFTKLLPKYLSDDEYRAFQWHLLGHPEAGDIIRGSGGVRKIRWGTKGSGKSGGVRIIYFWKSKDGEIWLLTLYSKKERASIPSHVLREIAKEIKDEG